MTESGFQPVEILRALERHNVEYVVIGGLAATLHGSPLMTSDALPILRLLKERLRGDEKPEV